LFSYANKLKGEVMSTRIPMFIEKTFNDENGNPRQGKFNIEHPKAIVICVNGKLDGKPAIIFPDGYVEDWEDGQFIRGRYPNLSDENKNKGNSKKL
jgi:hypothetical protein